MVPTKYWKKPVKGDLDRFHVVMFMHQCGTRFTVTNDGQRFLLNVPMNVNSEENIIIVQNWLEELKQK